MEDLLGREDEEQRKYFTKDLVSQWRRENFFLTFTYCTKLICKTMLVSAIIQYAKDF
jgi:hypothetical protein